MAKKQQRSKKAATKPKAKPKAAAAPPQTLIEITQHGFDALKARRRDGAAAGGKRGAEGRAFDDIIDRLKTDYERLLKETK